MKATKQLHWGRRRISYRRIATFFALVLITATNACYADTNQVTVGISDILHRVELATIPLRSYTATVHQTATNTNPLVSKATMSASQPNLAEEQDYVVICTTNGVVHPSKALSLKQLPQNIARAPSVNSSNGNSVGGSGGAGFGSGVKQQQNVIIASQLSPTTATTSTLGVNGSGSGGGGGGTGAEEMQPHQNATTTSSATNPTNGVRMLITINPINTLRHINQMQSGTIGEDVYQNTACYKISGADGRFSFNLWISKTDWSVCRETVLRDAEVLLDTQFEYKHWNGSLVPLRVVIAKPSNGTVVEQQYSAHAYTSTN